MDFQKLRLTGFKSFVEPTDFDILPGLTGIVGPNGCGKSNLLEALRWVMGATSAKALRAGGMEDVIFAGTGTAEHPGRPGRSWAEVSLHLDNENRSAPAQYNEHPMLEITRRITKKAEGTTSTYRINGKEVRAKDVQLLFADAASGANSPSLVRQGQVSELINAKPENRRKFLEEAAGVTGLHVRRHEAELRLKAASTNLERLEDVAGELEQQRGVLARQARQASRYRNIACHLQKAEALLAYARWTEAKTHADDSGESLKAALIELEEAAKLAASTHATREKAHEQIEPLRQREAEAAAALHRLEVEQENFEKELDRAKAEIERLQGDRERLERELAREKDLNSDAVAALESLATEEEQIRQREGSEAERLEAADREVEAAQAQLDEAEGRLEQAQRAFADARAERNAAEAALSRMDRVVMAAREEIVRVRDQLAQFEAEADTSGRITELNTELEAAQTAAASASEKLAQLDENRQRTEQAVETAQGPRDETRAALNAIQAEIDTLTRVLAASEPEGRSVLEDIEVAEGYEGALAAALGEDLEASDDHEADRHWSALGAQPIAGSGLSGATPLSQFVTGAPVLTRRLSSVGVVAAEDGARLAAALTPGQILVSREGDIWRWDGFVARAGAKTAAAARLEQKRQLTEQQAKLEAAFTARDEAEKALGEARLALTALAEERREVERARNTAQSRAAELERELGRLKGEAERRAAKGEALLTRKADADERLAAANTEHEAAMAAMNALPDLSALEQTVTAARHAREEARSGNGRARGVRAELRRDADARAARLKQISEQREGWMRRQGTAAERIDMVARTLAETGASIERAEKVPGELEQRRTSIYEAVTAAESRRRVAADELAGVQGTLTEAERLVRDADERAALARENKARAEAQGEASRERLKDAAARAQEIHEGPPEALLTLAEHTEDAPLPSHEVLEEKIDKLKREREALGGVNLCADQEMEEIDGRLSEIETEKADCEAAINKLRGAIGSLNRDGRQRLLDAFDTVNNNFRELFSELFGGGQAELRLIDSDDPLEAGLEIFACPPGKKLTQMSLMSGGEQALTATALIFAVFKSNPAPVCVLDEIDAPLDDANTDRFCAMLARMAKETSTRFIAITHHPLTMSRMDRLFGVTMIERGVSQLVSVDLAEAESMAA